MPYDRRPPERIFAFFFGIVLAIFILVSVSIAISDEDKCDGFPKREWKFFPPGWECKVR